MKSEPNVLQHPSGAPPVPPPPLLPARAALVAHQTALVELRRELEPINKRLEQLTEKAAAIAELRTERAAAAAEHVQLRAQQLRGEDVDEKRLGEIERRMDVLARSLNEQALEEAALGRAIGDLNAKAQGLRAAIRERETDLPRAIALAGREWTLEEIVAKGRLHKLFADFADGLADVLAGANIWEIQRLRDGKLPPLVVVKRSRERDELRIPMLLECPPFDAAIAGAGVDVMARMQERALALLGEFSGQPTK